MSETQIVQQDEREAAPGSLPIQDYGEDQPEAPIVRVAPYDHRAPRVAEIVADLIVRRLGPVTVEHVGSTAVPDCDGKGIIDLLLVVEPAQRKEVVRELYRLGFQEQSGGFRHPDERPMLEGAIEQEGERFRVHLHVVPASSAEPESMRAFRDRLRADPELRDEYVALKRAILDDGVVDREEYSRAKTRFIQRLVAEPPSDSPTPG